MSEKRFKPEKAAKLFSEERKKILPIQEIMEILQLNREASIADLGAGNGYFAVPFAKATKRVYAVDIEPEMLNMLKEYAAEKGVSNIEYVESDLEEIQLGDGLVELVFVAFVIHEVNHIDKSLEEFRRISKPGAEIVLLEWKPEEYPEMGPPSHERIAPQDLIDTLEKNGFHASVIYENEKVYGVKALSQQ
ncbi:class I SAM-dependent methyltransferase [Pseudalkalibacillus sp. Hm43]|uniref:class I SAM-dependent methyltransferase n=1 Tax=Pseudalkalibacillus sp. Hm43 TaxID=3450742 RepID=UPI003F43FE06